MYDHPDSLGGADMQLVIVKLQARSQVALRVQEVLTKHGCNITLRLGIHEQSSNECSNEGVIVLQVKPELSAVNALVEDLKSISQVGVHALSI
jgi:hypothetical protein